MKYFFLLFGLFFLSGCWLTTKSSSMPMGASPIAVWGIGETISYLSTGKLIEDNIASFITDKDCSASRYFKGEGKYCMTELEIERINRPKLKVRKVYCYKSMAQPTCYATPSPFKSDILIGTYEQPIFDQNP